MIEIATYIKEKEKDEGNDRMITYFAGFSGKYFYFNIYIYIF